jgi:hypothetical protein
MKAAIPTEAHTFDPDGDLVLILSRSPESAANIPISDTVYSHFNFSTSRDAGNIDLKM